MTENNTGTIQKKQGDIEVGNKIRTLRRYRGWTQNEACKYLDLSVPAYSKMENGITDINITRLKELAALFDVSAASLLMDTAPDMFYSRREVVEIRERMHSAEKKVKELQDKLIRCYEKQEVGV